MKLFGRHQKYNQPSSEQPNDNPSFPDWSQLENEGAIAGFQYPERHQAKSVPSEYLDNSIETLVHRAIIDGDPYTFEGQDYTLTPNALSQAGLEPHYELTLDGQRIGLSNTFKAHGRNAAIAYIETPDGKVHARSYYQSNSSGLWRYLPDYAADYTGYPNWFGKAYSEDSLNLPFELQKSLNEISKNGPIDTNGINSSFLLFGTAYKYPSKLIYRQLRDSGQLKGDFYQEVSSSPKYDFSSSTPGKTPPGSIHVNPYSMPDFHAKLSSTEFSSLVYPDATAESFPSQGGELNYTICSVTEDDTTRAWVGNMETNSPITSTGCRSEWVRPGDICTPLYEYASANPEEDQTGGYGSPNDTRNGCQSMWQNYLSKIPLIRAYLHETHKS